MYIHYTKIHTHKDIFTLIKYTITHMTTFLKRDKYLSQIKTLVWVPLIKVLIWQRRVGKSVLLRQIQQMRQTDETLLIDLENYTQREIYTSTDILYQTLSDACTQWVRMIWVDEIQIIPWREKVIVSLHNEFPHVDLFITWSNSTMLSSELTTLLRWRYYEIKIYPFSYDEFTLFYDIEKNEQSLRQFLTQWWYVGAYHIPSLEQQKYWISQMLDTVILRDSIERHEIQDAALFREILMFLVSSVCSPVNITNIQKSLQKKWHTTSLTTLQKYVWYLQETFLIYPCEFYDIQWHKIFNRMKKYYPADQSIRAYLMSNFEDGWGKLLENMIYMEAKKAGYKIYTGKKWSKEIDFVIEKQWEKKYLQVAYSLWSTETISREISIFSQINDHRPKYLISLDSLPATHNSTWIRFIHARDIATIL